MIDLFSGASGLALGAAAAGWSLRSAAHRTTERLGRYLTSVEWILVIRRNNRRREDPR